MVVKPKLVERHHVPEEKFRDLIDNLSVGVVALDLNWQVVYLNAVGEEILQKKLHDLQGKVVWDEFPEAIGRPFYHAYHKAVETGQSMYLEEYSPVLRRWMKAGIYPSAQGVAVYFQDITKQKRAEKRARQSEADYRQLLDRITDGFIAIDKNFCYTYVNQVIAKMVNMEARSMIGKNAWDLFPEEIGSAAYEALHFAMNEQCFVSHIGYHAPLYLWYELYIYPSPQGLSVFIRDISKQKRLELELKKQEQKQLAAALEAQEKERTFIGQELHDNVNQLLTATQITLEMTKSSSSESTALIDQCIENLKKAIYENRKLAHELVTPDLQSQTLVEQLTRLSKAMFGVGNVQVIIKNKTFNEGLLTTIQKLTLYRIAQEQFTNISKYAKACGVDLAVATDDTTISMIIADNGQGVLKENIQKGIGLKNIESRLKLVEGTMKINTSPGQGFKLIINLPIEK